MSKRDGGQREIVSIERALNKINKLLEKEKDYCALRQQVNHRHLLMRSSKGRKIDTIFHFKIPYFSRPKFSDYSGVKIWYEKSDVVINVKHLAPGTEPFCRL